MHHAVIVDAARSPIGRIRGGLAQVRPDNLLARVFSAVLERSGIPPMDVDEVVAGCANQAGEDNRNVARMAWLASGLPYEVPAFTVNRLCASGLDAVIAGTRSVWTGEHNAVLVGGVESMSRAPLVMGKGDAPFASGNRTAFDSALGWRFPNPKLEARFPLEAMGETAENIAEKYAIPRDRQDAFAVESHRRALAAQREGRFDNELIPIEVKERKTTRTVSVDEGPRDDSTLDKLATLRPVFRDGGTVTAGNSSTLNDGAAALLVTSLEKARQLGAPGPYYSIAAAASAGVHPSVMGLGPIDATRKALIRASLQLQDIEVAELNEAFAVQSLAVIDELGLDPDRVNVNGGAIALGHPLGCSGARILTTLVHEMKRRQAEVGLATLCVGVGQGVSVVVKRLDG